MNFNCHAENIKIFCHELSSLLKIKKVIKKFLNKIELKFNNTYQSLKNSNQKT